MFLIFAVFACSSNLAPADMDQDGFTWAEGDCDDNDSGIFPGAQEIWCDGIDQDCSGGHDADIFEDADNPLSQAAIEACGGVPEEEDTGVAR